MDAQPNIPAGAPGVAMPKYKCHKEVRALKIARIDYLGPQQFQLVFFEPGYAPLPVDGQWVVKTGAAPGGYFVVYADSWVSFSPNEAFEGGYTRIP